MTALHIATGSWNLPFVQALLERYGADEFAQAVSASDSKGQLPLRWALPNLDNTFDRPSDEQTMSTGLKVVNLLLESHPEAINVQSSHIAVFNFLANGYVWGAGRLAFMKFLLRFNSDISTVNARDQYGVTALLRILSYHETCNVVRESYTVLLVELLLAHIADRAVYDKTDQTALHKLAASPSYDDQSVPICLRSLFRLSMAGLPSPNGKKSAANRCVSYTSPAGC